MTGGLVAIGGADCTTGGVGGLMTGAGLEGRFAEGIAGASEAFRVTRTVSFFKGMLEVSLETTLEV